MNPPRLPWVVPAISFLWIVGFLGTAAAVMALASNKAFGGGSLPLLFMAFGLQGAGAIMVLMFFFGSSLGSRWKDGLVRPIAPGLPPTDPVAPPIVPPAGPDDEDGSDRPTIPGIGRSTPDGTQFQRRDIPYDGRYATVRYHCFGAHWPAKNSHLFGATGHGVLKDGNKITRYPHAINGIAGTLSLLRRKYVGKSFREAGSIWTTGKPGTSMRGKPGWDRNGTLTATMIDEGTPEFFDFLEGLGRNEAGNQYNISRDYLKMGWEMFKTGSADAYLDGSEVETPVDDLPSLPALLDAAMRRKQYKLFERADEINIIAVEGLDPNGSLNDDAPDKWNDSIFCLTYEGGAPTLLGAFQATTEPGLHYTRHPIDPAGAARIEFGQYRSFRIDLHRGQYEALCQLDGPDPEYDTDGTVTVRRDANKDMIRTGDALDTGHFGINLHWGYDVSTASIGRASAGCLVIRKREDFDRFMEIIKSDPRYGADHKFVYTVTVLAERDVVTE